MSPIGQSLENRSGGKAARNRRAAASATPYDRAASSLGEGVGSPNWLSSATRKVAEGAGRVVRSVLWSDSSSSSSIGAESSFSGDEVSADACCRDVSSVDRKGKDGSLNEDEGGRKMDSRITEWGSDTKRAIVMLLMQETFSQDECDCLINIIKARNVDSSHSEDVQGKRPGAPSRAFSHLTDACCIAVLEARKWINEQKLLQDSKSVTSSSITSCNYGYGSSSYSSKQVCSPVGIARSYTCGHSPYPLTRISAYQTPQSLGTQSFSDVSPLLNAKNSKKVGLPIEIARSYMCGRPPSPVEIISAYQTPQSSRMQSFSKGSPLSKGKALSFTEDVEAAFSCNVAKDTKSNVNELPQEADI